MEREGIFSFRSLFIARIFLACARETRESPQDVIAASSRRLEEGGKSSKVFFFLLRRNFLITQHSECRSEERRKFEAFDGSFNQFSELMSSNRETNGTERGGGERW